jgi:triacylglycerol lipase
MPRGRNLEFARRLCRAGVPVELHVYPGVFHGFGNVKQSSMYRRYQADRLVALQRAF